MLQQNKWHQLHLSVLYSDTGGVVSLLRSQTHPLHLIGSESCLPLWETGRHSEPAEQTGFPLNVRRPVLAACPPSNFIFLNYFSKRPINNAKECSIVYVLYRSLVGFFKSVLQEEEEFLFVDFVGKRKHCADSGAGKRHNTTVPSVSPDVGALSWLSVLCPSSVATGRLQGGVCRSLPRSGPLRGAAPIATVQRSMIITLRLVAALFQASLAAKWQFYINHLSDILWAGLVVPTGLPVHSLRCVCGPGGWCAGERLVNINGRS